MRGQSLAAVLRWRLELVFMLESNAFALQHHLELDQMGWVRPEC